jgi:hypothetical protein
MGKGREGKGCIQGFGEETKEGDPDVDGKMILRWSFNSGELVPTLLQWKSNNYYVF